MRATVCAAGLIYFAAQKEELGRYLNHVKKRSAAEVLCPGRANHVEEFMEHSCNTLGTPSVRRHSTGVRSEVEAFGKYVGHTACIRGGTLAPHASTGGTARRPRIRVLG